LDPMPAAPGPEANGHAPAPSANGHGSAPLTNGSAHPSGARGQGSGRPDAGAVVWQFQQVINQVMTCFLETQRAVMLTYLGDGTVPGAGCPVPGGEKTAPVPGNGHLGAPPSAPRWSGTIPPGAVPPGPTLPTAASAAPAGATPVATAPPSTMPGEPGP